MIFVPSIPPTPAGLRQIRFLGLCPEGHIAWWVHSAGVDEEYRYRIVCRACGDPPMLKTAVASVQGSFGCTSRALVVSHRPVRRGLRRIRSG